MMGDFILERVNLDEKIILKRDETYTYGREKNNEIVRVGSMISRKHCVFIVTASNVKIIDSGSCNGVYLNGTQIPPHTPTNVKVNDVIGIACGDLENVPIDNFVYKLKRQENGISQKRKSTTICSEIPSKILKTEPADSPEIVTIDDDDTSVQSNLLSTTTLEMDNVIHPSLMKQEEIIPNIRSNVKIEFIDLEELDLTRDDDTSTENNQTLLTEKVPQNPVNSNYLIPKTEFIPQNVSSHRNMETNQSDSLDNDILFHFIKCEPTSPEDQDIFTDLSPQPSTSNIKQEVTSSDSNYIDSHYSQTELICLSDDNIEEEEEEEIYFPRSQLFDEIITDTELKNNVTSIKQEPTTAFEEPIDSYSEPDDIPLIELTDDENDYDQEDNENTKAWLHKLLSSQLENTIAQIKVQPPEEEEEEDEEGEEDEDEEEYYAVHAEDNKGKLERPREVEYGQLNDVIEHEVNRRYNDDNYFIHEVEKLVDEIKELERESENEEDQINQNTSIISDEVNNITDVAMKTIDSSVSNKSDTSIDIEGKSKQTNNKNILSNNQLKKNKLTEKKRKKEKSSKIKNKQRSIEQSKLTSDEISESKMVEDSDSLISSEIVDEDTDYLNTIIDKNLHGKKIVKSDKRTSIDNRDNHSKMESYSDKTDHKSTKLQTKIHDKKSSKKDKKINNNRNEKGTHSRISNSERTNTTSNKSLLSSKEKSELDAIKTSKDTTVSKHFDDIIDKKISSKMTRCINSWEKKEKKVEQIDPPFFPKGERRAVSVNITATTSGTLQDQSLGSDDDIFTANKTVFAPHQKEDKHAVDKDASKKEKQLKRLRHKFGGDNPSLQQKISNEQKRKIKEERSEKLKQLHNKPHEMKTSEHQIDTNRRLNKPKVKVSEKNRGAFLTPDEINNDNIKNNLSDSNHEGFEKMIVPKSQELKQNTAAQDLFDVISSSSARLSNHKSPESEKKVEQKISGKENSAIENKIKPKRASTETEKAMATINNNDCIEKSKPIITSNVSVKLPDIKYYTGQRDTKKAVSPLRGILRSVKKRVTKPKKTVHFNDKTEVKLYLIDEGNRIETKCTQKDMKIEKTLLEYNLRKTQIDRPRVELFLAQVFQWRPIWLNEQQDNQTPPPIIDRSNISSVSLTYKAYADYYRIMSTLMFIETWCIMSKDYEKLRKRPILYASVVEQSVSQEVADSSTNLQLTTFMIEALVTEQAWRYKQYPVYGDLVMLELAGTHKGKTNFTQVFAYITALNYTVITPHTRYNTALNRLTTNPYILITYTMKTKKLPFAILTQKPGRLKTVIYLRSHMRMVQALYYLPHSPLLDAILNPTPEAYQLPFVPHYESLPLVTKDKLNKKQRESVFRIAEAVVKKTPGIFLVKGPPGTGKSKVIINLITEILYGRKKNKKQDLMKILVCAPSNTAVDEIVSRLKTIRSNVEDPAYKFKMVRIGRLEAVSPAVRSCHVTELAKRDVEKTLADYHAAKNSHENIEKQKDNLIAHINSLREECSEVHISEMQKEYLMRKTVNFRAKYELFSNCNPSAPINQRLLAKVHQAAENTILAGANIIACTLSSCYTNQMESIFGKSNGRISVCIVDEATQSSEPETLIPLMLGVSSLVLVGDPNQLPATVISPQAKKLGFDKSLFARIYSVFNGIPHNPIIMLNTQYRMSDRIMFFPNRYFYNNAIVSAASKERLPFHFYKVFNLSSHQDDSNKFSNTDEATFVANLIYTMAMNAHKIRSFGIGIITPYNDQRVLINQKISVRMANVPEEIKKKVTTEVNTVDSFQGQERDVVIMSCVRSNGIGFLSDRQRLCVALTRAKFSLVLCGNFKTFEKDPMWFELLKDARDRNIYINLDCKAEPEKIKEFIIR